MAKSPDVVVVGGGVVGTAVAYFLSREGVAVTLVEKKAISAGSSDHGPGFFNTFGGDFLPGSHLALAIESVRLIREHRETLGSFSDLPQWFNDKPDLALAFDPAGEARLREMYAGAREQIEAIGEAGRWLDGAAVREREPLIAEDVLGGYLFPSCIQIDGVRLSHLYAAAAQSNGARIVIGEVTGMDWAGSRTTGITLRDGGSLSAGAVVLAMGSWSPLASVWTGYPLPVCSLKGQLNVLSAPGYTLGYHLIERVVLMQYPDGRLLIGATPDPAPGGGLQNAQAYIRPLTDTGPSDDDMNLLLDVGRKRFPFLKDAEVIDHRSGVRPMSPDLLPIIGRVPVYDNVYTATGHGRKGIHLSPGTGALIRDLILTGKPATPFDAEPFSPGRFMPTAL